MIRSKVNGGPNITQSKQKKQLQLGFFTELTQTNFFSPKNVLVVLHWLFIKMKMKRVYITSLNKKLELLKILLLPPKSGILHWLHLSLRGRPLTWCLVSLFSPIFSFRLPARIITFLFISYTVQFKLSFFQFLAQELIQEH